MVTGTCLSALARLEALYLGFHSPRPCPDWECRRPPPPPPTCTALPTLTCLRSNCQLSYLAQVFGSSFPQTLIPTVEHLKSSFAELSCQDDMIYIHLPP